MVAGSGGTRSCGNGEAGGRAGEGDENDARNPAFAVF
jgi:hypothetical protein